jgi:superoxide dismutase, Cu-Zn family
MKNGLILFGVALFLTGGSILVAQEGHVMHQKLSVKRAIAVITAAKGGSVSGVVKFEEVEKGLHVVADLTGLKNGKHGFHIHEFGDISSGDGSSAGGHFNPMQMPHSMPTDKHRHAGDMGNITADENGNAHLDYIDPVMKLNGKYSIIGHAVIIHAGEDDFKTQPTGNSGAREGYGVVGIAK